MSLIAVPAHTSGLHLSRLSRRIAVAALAVALVGSGVALVGWVFGLADVAPAPRNPFGTGLREAAPEATGLGGWILAVQSAFYRGLTGTLGEIRHGGGSAWTLVGIGFAYGAFHAAGPGHGKGVIAGYLIATKRTLAKGLALSLAAALVQAGVAIGLVVVFAVLMRAGAASLSTAAGAIEILSFGALAAVGLGLLWQKTARVVLADGRSHPADGLGPPRAHHHHAHGHGCDTHCGHHHVPPPAAIERLSTWRETAGIVLAAGIRPCSGAIILLVFALSQDLLATGIAATLAMALGTAVTTGALAALAVLAKGAAVKLAAEGGRAGENAVAWLEVLAAAFVAVLGSALLFGAWSGGLPS